MKFDELRKRLMAETTSRPTRNAHDEHDSQVACVRWFRIAFPQFANSLFAVPNGAMLNGSAQQRLRAGKRLRDEGMLKGVADLILLVPTKDYHGLCIEMKSKGGVLRSEQREWGQYIETMKYKYVVIKPTKGRNALDIFIETVKSYFFEKKL